MPLMERKRGYYTEKWDGYSQPKFIDEIAVDFQEFKIIVSHGENGFSAPILAVAQRHLNIYLEFRALTPSYMASGFNMQPIHI